MSNNLGQFGGGKNPAWGRNNNPQNMVSQNNQGLNMPQMMNQMGNMNNTAVLQFQQQHPQVFQNALGIQQQNLGIGLQQMANNALGASQLASNQIFQQVSSVSYPNPRALNSAAFQTPQNMPPLTQMSGNNTNTKQRVFTGTVTKVHDNFGFVDEEVFFQTNACSKGLNPSVGDRVLVEASYNPSMPFKWNATRIQVLPTTGGNSNQQISNRHTTSSSSAKNYSSSGYNAVPPPEPSSNFNSNRNNNSSRPKASAGGRGRERSRDRDREDEEIERKRRREERQREREKEEKKSPVRRRSRSPKARRRPRIVPRYMVQIPKIALNLFNADVLEVRRRYANMYIPSDFFHSNFEWTKAFPSNKPFSLSKPCSYHIMSKDAESVTENDAVLEPPDCDYLFSAKVMLINVPGMDELYHKCCPMAEDEDKKDGRDAEEKDYIHPSRLINFLVGLRGKNETMAIGGPWSPSLDGPNPEKDPSVLIRTAIRTCKALTGIDLSNCTQWYRFVELYYHRSESIHKAKTVPARIETVVIYLPDVWSCLPTRLEWDNLVQSYQRVLERELKADQEPSDQAEPDEKEEEQVLDKADPTHYSQLDVKSMTVNDLKKELVARNAISKGLKSQLAARLGKLLKAEAEKDSDETKETVEDSEPETPVQEEKKPEVEQKKLDEKEKAALQKRYTLPEQQHIIVHPSKTAKSGKFDCTVMSLSLLLDYRPEDTKEHFFEVSIFAELFNEMLMRDFGFNIYKALHQLPEKAKEKEDPKKREKDDRKADDKKKHDDKKKEEEKKKDGDKKEDEDKQQKEEDKEKKIDDTKDKDRKKSETKRRSYESDEEKESDEDDDKDKKKDRDKKKNRVKLYTKHKHLLLSFVYFDQTHCGYIFDKDIEDLLNNLGLSLSRAQIRKLVARVVTRDSLHYRKLTDKAKDEESPIKEELEDSYVKELAVGNNGLLPLFIAPRENEEKAETASTQEVKSSEGMVMFQGALVDVGKLMLQLERSDKARIEADARVSSLKVENNKLSEKYDKANQHIKRINSELKDYKEKYRNTEDTLSKTLAYSKLFQTTLTEIRDKIDPVLKSTSINKEESMKKEKEVDRDKKDKDEGKSRWEKDVKTEMEVDESAEEKPHPK